ncbi:MAG: energy transducer TonB [Prevotella sp.]|nr:energy transducer TonB [Bacteroides sp.]MCM1367108.1 energy transducer TonB [Prevotella sp.]MCM1437430.1 energy transducer TonB [Prevotella sp.]
MILRILTSTLIFITAITIGILPSKAQICKLRCSSSGEGKNKYIEVYEYDYVNEKPSFPGGDSKLISFINDTREYPTEAYRKGITGRVTCSFVVNSDGSITHIRVLKGVEPSLNKEALRIFSKMPAWIPGRIDNIAVPVRVIRSISFRK